MCSSPVRIPSRSRTYYGGMLVYNTIPCGHCAECNSVAVSDMHVRAYHEMLDVFDAGGYIWYDTLTYNDDNLPHIDDFADASVLPSHDNFSCFDNSHLTNALKRLRFAWKDKIRIFIVPEYGNDDRFSHRPHYHVLMYVYSDPSTASEFGNELQRCWPYGFTEFGNPFNAKALDHYCISSYANASKACGYLSKYISKQYAFLDVIRERLDFVKASCPKLYRRIMPRRRLSVGFGLSALVRHADSVINSDSINYTEGLKAVSFKLSKYYVRSLYQFLSKVDGVHCQWLYKPFAASYLSRIVDARVDRRIDYYKTTIQRGSKTDVDFINSTLNGRSLRSLAVYDVVFRDRLVADRDKTGISDKVLPSFEQIVASDMVRQMFYDIPSRLHYIHDEFGQKNVLLLSDTAVNYSSAVLGQLSLSPVRSVVVSYENLPVVDCSYLPEWHDFDALLGCFARISRRYANSKDLSATYEAQVRNYFKSLRNNHISLTL